MNSYVKKVNDLSVLSNKKVFTTIIKQVNYQKNRLIEISNNLENIILDIFSKDTLTYYKYTKSLEIVSDAMIQNYKTIIRYMDNFDDKEYILLQNFDDDRPIEDLTIKKLTSYELIIDEIKTRLKENDELLLKLKELSIELLKKTLPSITDDAKEKVNVLIEQLKYYE